MPASSPSIARFALPGDSAAGAAAREFVSRHLRRWLVAPEAIDLVVLLTSELVTNAVKHGPPPAELTLILDGDHVRAEVGDSSDLLPAIAAPRPAALGGRGLWLVEALSDGWGWRAEPSGKTVWFQVPAH